MNTISGTSIVCCSNQDITHDDITSTTITNSGLITTLDLKATNHIDTATLTATEYEYKDSGANIYDNLNISYNAIPLLFYSWIPQTAGFWWELQNNVSRTVLKVPNDNIKVGSTFHLSMGLEIKDLTAASPNIVDFALKLGSGTISQLGFATEPPKSLTPIIVSIDADIICTAKTVVAPLEYSFIIRANFTENNDSQATQNNYVKSSLIQNIPYVLGTPNFMNFMYQITGSNGSTTYERGVYRLYQTV